MYKRQNTWYPKRRLPTDLSYFRHTSECFAARVNMIKKARNINIPPVSSNVKYALCPGKELAPAYP